jgi:hypothetical protein
MQPWQVWLLLKPLCKMEVPWARTASLWTRVIVKKKMLWRVECDN